MAKPDIEALKPDIEKSFQPKTASHILKLREAFPGQTVFGRADVMKVIDIKSSRASDLLKEMAEHRIIESVSGHGKGKYRFHHQESWGDGISDLFRQSEVLKRSANLWVCIL